MLRTMIGLFSTENNVGNTTAEKLVEHFTTIENIKSATKEALLEAPEIGEKIAESVLEYFNDEANNEFIQKLASHGLQLEGTPKPAPLSTSLEGKSFVISGVFEKYGRDEIKDIIKENGGKLLSSVTGKLDYLVAGDKIGPSKLEKAEKLGVTIISENTLESMLDK